MGEAGEGRGSLLSDTCDIIDFLLVSGTVFHHTRRRMEELVLCSCVGVI